MSPGGVSQGSRTLRAASGSREAASPPLKARRTMSKLIKQSSPEARSHGDILFCMPRRALIANPSKPLWHYQVRPFSPSAAWLAAADGLQRGHGRGASPSKPSSRVA